MTHERFKRQCEGHNAALTFVSILEGIIISEFIITTMTSTMYNYNFENQDDLAIWLRSTFGVNPEKADRCAQVLFPRGFDSPDTLINIPISMISSIRGISPAMAVMLHNRLSMDRNPFQAFNSRSRYSEASSEYHSSIASSEYNSTIQSPAGQVQDGDSWNPPSLITDKQSKKRPLDSSTSKGAEGHPPSKKKKRS